jgi:hypothetical protein
MVRFLNLRDVGRFDLRRPETDLCGVVRSRAKFLRALQGATVARFLIASGQLLETGLSRSEQRRKHFLIGSFSPCLQRSAVLAFHSESSCGEIRVSNHYSFRQKPVGSIYQA